MNLKGQILDEGNPVKVGFEKSSNAFHRVGEEDRWNKA